MKADEIKRSPKVFCESIQLATTPEYFVMSLTSGADATAYALTPQHAKRLVQYLSHQVSQYEKEYGTINADWKPQIVSPIQPKKKS